MNAQELIRILRRHGFEWDKSGTGKGSHRVYVNRATGQRVRVPFHGRKELPKGYIADTLKKIGAEE